MVNVGVKNLIRFNESHTAFINFLNLFKPFAMTQLLVRVDSENTATAIKQFISQFADASIETKQPADIDHQALYGIDQATFDAQLNIGIS